MLYYKFGIDQRILDIFQIFAVLKKMGEFEGIFQFVRLHCEMLPPRNYSR